MAADPHSPASAPSSSPTPLRLVVIGGGPRALWALEELAQLHAEHATATATTTTTPRTPAPCPIEVTVIEPHDPGSGWVYRADQPRCWRLNAPAAIVTTALGTLPDWAAARGITIGHFPPRALVGEFLRASWDHLLDTTADLPTLSITHLRARATRITPNPTSRTSPATPWHVATTSTTSSSLLADAVLVTTGHARTWPGRLPAPALDPYAPEQLSPAHIAPGAHVTVRGAALTFIDVALALTEGRAGRFTPTTPGAWTYTPSGREPATILPLSRSGRFMEVKPTPGTHLHNLPIPNLAAAEHTLRHARSIEDVRRTLITTALSLLDAAPASPTSHPTPAPSPATSPSPATATDALTAILDGRDASADPVADFRASAQVITGQRPPSPAWALGEAWRRLYSALIERLATGPLPGFPTLARTMERVAFGPPIDTAGRILALIDAGIVSAPSTTEPNSTSTTDPTTDPDPDTVLVDAVIPPPGIQPGTIAAHLRDDGLLTLTDQGLPDLNPDGTLPRHPTLALIGRDAEGTVLGHDTLSRTLHPTIPLWSRSLMSLANPTPPRTVAATLPLTARLEPWMTALAAQPRAVNHLIDTYDSPVNVLCPDPLARNAAELTDAGTARDVDVRVFFARKANKGLTFVDAARDAGHGIDVASLRELQQVLDRNVPAERIILSAAVKNDHLLRVAIDAGVAISVDSVDELHRCATLATTTTSPTTARVVPRIAPDPATLPPTRFGELRQVWIDTIAAGLPEGVSIVGVHMHLHGYSEADRRLALGEALDVVDAATDAGEPVEFIDMGGGVPMSYLDDAEQWEAFHHALAEQRAADANPSPTTPADTTPVDPTVAESLTWKRDPLRNTYPFHQSPTRGEWLARFLDGEVTPPSTTNSTNPDNPTSASTTPAPRTAAEHLRSRGLRLHMEPGRSLLDGCGVILARVAFVKRRSDGLGLVGLEMNRTQCRTTSDDILLDPILIPSPDAPATGAAPSSAFSGYLVGAYCIEDEVIIRRCMHFPHGVRPGDTILIPNTAGYFMHILESASHQIPLARNVALLADAAPALNDSPANVDTHVSPDAIDAHLPSPHAPSAQR